MAENEINKVNVLIRRFIFEVDGILDDKDSCQKWLMSFAKTLQFQDLYKGEPNEYALFLLREANDFNSAQRRKIQIRYARKSLKENGIDNPTRDQIDAMIEKMSSASEFEGENDLSEQRVGGNSCQGLVTAPAAPSHKATAPSTRIAPAEPEVLNLAYSGEFSNVRLTQEQYNSLLQKFGNKTACDRAIDSLSAKIENGEIIAKSHYAVLVKWVNYRVDKAEEKELDESKPKMSNMEKSWIASMKKVEMM